MLQNNPALDALFAPKSLALVGVSDRAGSYGQTLRAMCRAGGFSGHLTEVNPRLAPGSNGAILSTLDDLAAPPDHVVLSLATARIEAGVDAALRVGARALTIFSECPDPAMRNRIAARIGAAGAALCGPNSMGLHNLTEGLRITPFAVPLDLKPGGVGLIAQSGSVLGALMNNDPRLRFCQAISTGSETVTTAADYLMWMARRPETRCIGLFLESVRDPQGFIAAMEAAARRDIPVVILKVGRSALSARMAVSHTGALVGDDDVFRALVTRLGGHMAGSLDDLAAMLAVFSQNRRAAAPGIASIHDSGGERELMADMAEDHGLRYADLSDQTRARIQAVLEPGIAAENPLDAWGTGDGAEHTYIEATAALMDDPGVGSGLYVLNWRRDYTLHQMHARALRAAFRQTDKPLVAVSNYARSNDAPLADQFAEDGIPLISGMQNAMAAIRALHHHHTPAPFRPATPPHPRADAWRARLRHAPWISEAQGYALFSDYAIPVPAHGLADNRADAVALADSLGGPVVIKTTQPGLAHKTDVAGVRTDLRDAATVAAAYDDMAARLGPEVLVARMVPTGSEWALGVVNDADFGPVLRISPGGILVDLLPEAALLMAPVTPDAVRRALAPLRAARLLRGMRGAPAQSLDALAGIAAALSHLAWDLRDVVSEVEINPVIVSQHSAFAVDAVIRCA